MESALGTFLGVMGMMFCGFLVNAVLVYIHSREVYQNQYKEIHRKTLGEIFKKELFKDFYSTD